MTLVSLRAVEVGYHRRRILPPVDLMVARGSFLGIVGPNGSGKTTLLRTLLGLLPPIGGTVEYPAGRRPRFGYVPQRAESDRAFPVTAFDMVLMARAARRGLVRRLGGTDRAAATAALDRVGIADLAGRSLGSLSGGQRQRALIARALATEPELLVLDEPTNGMDLVGERAVLDLIESLRAQLDLAVIMVSHQLALLANFVAEVLLLDKERQLVEHGPVGAVVTAARLSALYGADVQVHEVAGHRTVFLRCGPGTAAEVGR